MDRSYLPPAEFLCECFSLDEETGVLTWRRRPATHFKSVPVSKAWNTRYAGTQADKRVPSMVHSKRETLVVRVSWHEAKYRVPASHVVFKMRTGGEAEQIDHINGNPLDNRPQNLRPAGHAENQRNTPGYKSREYPKGVYPAPSGRFSAMATHNGKPVYLGRFDTPGEAHAAWCEWARRAHGEFFNSGPARVTIFD